MRGVESDSTPRVRRIMHRVKDGRCLICKSPAFIRGGQLKCSTRHQDDIDYEIARRERIRSVVRALKDHPCVDCGVRYPYYVMQFDHVRGSKIRDVSTIVSSRAEKMLHAEVSKCDIVCANCHAERTHRSYLRCLP